MYNEYYENGNIHIICNYRKNKKDGFYKSYHINGQKEEHIIYLEDKMYVYYISYYDNGNINKEVLYINSKKNGIYKEYDYNGDIIEMFEYKDDVLIHDYEIEYV